MKVNSSGLGKTTLIANFGVLAPVEGSTPGLKMTIESTQPIHWHITVALDGADIRQFIGIILKPKLIITVLKMLFTPAPKTAVAETKPVAAVPTKSVSVATTSAKDTR